MAKNEENTDLYWEEEFYDFLAVLAFGARKYGCYTWQDPNGNKASFKAMHDSMQRHLTASLNNERFDPETNLDPLLHLASRALMMYVRIKRNIKHPED